VKTVLVANFREDWVGGGKKYPRAALERYLRAQIDLHMALGRGPGELCVLTTFPGQHGGVSYEVRSDLNQICPTGSKTFAMARLFEEGRVDDLTWCHDLDLWPCLADHPDLGGLDMGLARYRKSWNGGSVYWTPKGRDLCLLARDTIDWISSPKEEPVLNRVWDQRSPRIRILGSTWNIGCSGFEGRVARAELPVRCVHFHPDKAGQHERFVAAGVMSDLLKTILKEHFPS
jgi:hypothetical protein